MMIRLVTRLAMAIALVGCLIVFVGVIRAAADTGCVSEQEFATVPYTHKTHVEAFWGVGPGRRSDHVQPTNPNLIAYEYPSCTPGGWAVAVYRKTTLQAQQYYLFTPTRENR